MSLRITAFSLCLFALLLGSCDKDEQTFNKTDCDRGIQPVDTAEVGLVKYWLDVSKDSDGQVKVIVRSNSNISIDDMDALYIQLNNRYGCYQTKNREKFYAIAEDYFLFKDIPPTFDLPETQTNVNMQLNDTVFVVLKGTEL